VTPPNVETAEFWALPSLTEGRRAAARDAWAAFWTSRAVVWGAGMLAILAFGWAAGKANRLDPVYLTSPFSDSFLNLLAAPAARFDSVWFTSIAQHGYAPDGRSAFFPLLPALMAVGGKAIGSQLVAGGMISFGCGLGGLYLLHRLVSLDFGLERARTTVWLAAWFPGAMVLSAVYSESLFLLLSVGAIYGARLGRWRTAGLLGGLAAASRSGGLVLLVPLLLIYLYGPRADRPEPEEDRGPWPRYRLRPDILWIVAGVPAGLLAYLGYLGMTTGEPMAVFSAQQLWHRSFIPLAGIPVGLWSAIRSTVDLVVPGFGRTESALARHGLPTEFLDVRDLVTSLFLIGGLWLTYEASRRLNLAYASYAVCGLALPLSVPATGYALMSLPRFMFVLFPLWIALALWASDQRRVQRLLWLFGLVLGVSSGLFSVWAFAP
jgi:mannosyltransferase PIG-V